MHINPPREHYRANKSGRCVFGTSKYYHRGPLFHRQRQVAQDELPPVHSLYIKLPSTVRQTSTRELSVW